MVRSLRSIGLAVLALVCVSQAAFAQSTAALVVGGAESQRFDQSWDVGPIQISFNGFAETISYGQYSSPASVASSIAGQFTRDYLKNGLCAHASGSTVTFILSGSSAFGTLTSTNTNTSFYFSTAGFAGIPIAPPPTTGTVTTQTATTAMTGGSDAGTFYDSGTVTVQVSGATAQADWNEGATPASVASTLASAINASAGGFVSANLSGNSVIVTSLNDGPAADMSITGGVADSNPDYFSTASFSVSTQNMSGGAFSAGSPLYSFVIPDQGGYDLNGNLLSVTDSVMGQWNYAYDNLNRLTQATAPVSQPTGVNTYYAGVQPTWTYDPFGNRLTESQGAVSGATPTASMPPNTTTTFTTTGNQINTTTLGTGITYDAAGDITYDGTNSYLYDAEGRLCAVNNSGALTGYIYDASGIRVAKGSLTSFSCNFASNGYATTSSYVLGPGGEQVTEYNGAGTWQHTNAFASGALLASYHDTDTYFALNDWLGTKRAEISAGGQIANYHSLAYGNGFTQTGTAPDATEHHFTGKERDAESGNDYFEARYYSSSMGRFMSPDWSAKEDPVPYAQLDDPQSLNLYSYVRNNPLSHADADGHCPFCIPLLAGGGSVLAGTEEGAAIGAFGGPVGAGIGAVIGLGVGLYVAHEISEHESEPAPAAAAPAPTTQTPTGPYDVGTAADLKGGSNVGDGLDVHHVPQQQPASQTITGYDGKTAPAIALPKGEHKAIPTEKGTATRTPRGQLAKDAKDLRNHTNAPNSQIQKVINQNKQQYPEMNKTQ